jgi:anti-anti-sigma factor
LVDTSLSGRLPDTSLSGSFFIAGKGKFCVGCGKTVSQSFTICTRCGTPVSTYRQVEVRKEGDAIVVQFSKQHIVDEPAVKDVTEELFTVADRAGQQNLLLDLSRVLGLSSLMLGKLVMLQRKMLLQKRQLKLCNVGAEVREVLAATKLDRVLRVVQGERPVD